MGTGYSIKLTFDKFNIEFDGFISDVVRGLRLRFRPANKPFVPFQIIKVHTSKLIERVVPSRTKKTSEEPPSGVAALGLAVPCA